MNRYMKVICCILIIVIFLIILLFSILEWQLKYRYYLPYKESNLYCFKYDIKKPENATLEDVTNDIDALFDNPVYKLKIDNLQTNIYGDCNIFTRQITIKKNISYTYYVFSLTHELIHLTYFTYCERFCNLMAFKTLYTSNNEYFKGIALYFVNLDLQGGFSKEYSFVGYLDKN